MSTEYRSLYADHVAEMRRRWEAALEAEPFVAVAVHSGTPMVAFQDDYEYAFRPNPHFLAWLPLTRHSDSVLLIVPGERPRLFYFQPDDYWYLPPADPEPWWADHFEIEVVREAQAWRSSLESVLASHDLAADRVAAIGDSPALKGVFKPETTNPRGLVTRLQVARTRKTPYEVACIDAAARKAAAAHVAAERAFREGESEFDIHLRYMAACRQSDAELPYNNIVALNTHGAVLHYQARDRELPADVRSFLIDAGCAVNAYASDITRTYSKGPGEFADLIKAMDEVERDLVGQVRAGLDYRDLFIESHRQVARVLADAAIIRVSAEDAVDSGLSLVFYPHGLGHFLGLQTHDVAGLIDNEGNPLPLPEGYPALRLTRVLEEGNVLTIEPGLYFIDTLLESWRRDKDASMIDWDRVEALKPFGGIRIEDNVVVRADGCDNLTRAAFEALKERRKSR
ncbi:MAG: Xaa-Pro dipeptidase [Gammaproteobacteria bacterium]|nr:Xaa-Pro dipeptidase [Gammaproteobacteria bacterium]